METNEVALLIEPLEMDIDPRAVEIHMRRSGAVVVADRPGAFERGPDRAHILQAILDRGEAHAEIGAIEFGRGQLKQLGDEAQRDLFLRFPEDLWIDLTISHQ